MGKERKEQPDKCRMSYILTAECMRLSYCHTAEKPMQFSNDNTIEAGSESDRVDSIECVFGSKRPANSDHLTQMQ